MPVSWVQWLDASKQTEYQEFKDHVRQLGKGQVMDTVGWVLQDDADGILLTLDADMSAQASRFALFIPRAMIIKVQPL